MVKIGDGTAPPGFPAYSRYMQTASSNRIICNFNNCGHLGDNGLPCKMDCDGINCSCPCCRMLSGTTEYGCKLG